MSRRFLTGISPEQNRLRGGVTRSETCPEPSAPESFDAPPDESAFGPLTVYRHRAMASDFEISVNETDAAREEPFDAFDLIDRDEETLSVFRPSSLISRINALAGEMDITVPRPLFDRFLLCRRLWEETEGAFDITASKLWKLWGFAKGEGRVPTSAEIGAAMELVGMNHVRLDETRLTVAFDAPGVEINFGGIGKGMALDEVGALFAEAELGNFLVHGGMSSVLARGGRAGDVLTKSDLGKIRPCWTIGVADPLHPEKRLATVRLADEAVGTGGSGRQFFFHQGKRLSHIIDPRTGYPATGVLAATVIAPNAAEADALSTAFFVMGVEKSEAYLAAHPEYRALLVLETKGGGTELRRCGNWTNR